MWVYTEGSSPLLPALHAILGLRKLDGISGPLQEHWQQGRRRMPLEHRQFLDSLERTTSVRAYCLCAWRQASVEKIAAMEDAFNNCIEALEMIMYVICIAIACNLTSFHLIHIYLCYFILYYK